MVEMKMSTMVNSRLRFQLAGAVAGTIVEVVIDNNTEFRAVVPDGTREGELFRVKNPPELQYLLLQEEEEKEKKFRQELVMKGGTYWMQDIGCKMQRRRNFWMISLGKSFRWS